TIVDKNNQKSFDFKINSDLSYGFLKNSFIEFFHRKLQ
ncbi:MAG: hypothetical protein ACJA1Z_001465, partial [Patiriisocius sp.]